MEDGLKCIDIFDCVSSPHVTPDADVLLSLSFHFFLRLFLGIPKCAAVSILYYMPECVY